jgi:hypothetical protein
VQALIRDEAAHASKQIGHHECVIAAIFECLRFHFGYLAKENLAIDSSRALLTIRFLRNRSASSGDAQVLERPNLTLNVTARMKLGLKSLILDK